MMKRLKLILRRSFVAGILLILVASTPLPAFAETSPTTTADQAATVPADPVAPSPPAATGVDHPTGASAHTYAYNEASGLWENDYYTWNPGTKETLAKTALEYTYNPQTRFWDTSVWQYNTAQDQYILTPLSVVAPPDGSITHGGPAAAATPEALSSDLAAVDPAIATGSDSAATTNLSNPTSSSDSQSLALNTTTNANLLNVITSAADSGNAIAVANTTVGNLGTGNANASATIMNLLQSSSSLAGSGLALFTTDIQGDVNGDMLIDPAAFMQPAGLSQMDLNKLTINNQLDGTIRNDINLSAASGGAGATANTTVGDITTGNANAVANVLNMINSVVAANQSFLGVINIYGNYTGDILVPTDMLNTLLAGNSPTAAVDSQDSQSSLNSSSNQQIANTIDLAAASGNVLADGNTRVGNATSGKALTKLTILNLTGRQVNAANSLLVFVNVLGTWVGVIMDAPAGTTAAALGGGVASDAPAGTTTASTDTNATLNDNAYITNNITARAQSGNAAATANTTVGDITTGNATASANIFNLANSSFSLSHWFGVLFINVFGSWHGSFGAAKPPVTPPETVGSTVTPESVRVFSFVPGGHANLGLSRVTAGGFGGAANYDEFVDNVSEVLAANKVVEKVIQKQALKPKAQQQPGFSLAALPLFLGFAGITFVTGEKLRSMRRKIAYHLR